MDIRNKETGKIVAEASLGEHVDHFLGSSGIKYSKELFERDEKEEVKELKELLNCPFCGKEVTIEYCTDCEGFAMLLLEHECNIDGIEISISIEENNRHSLIKAWNTRSK